MRFFTQAKKAEAFVFTQKMLRALLPLFFGTSIKSASSTWKDFLLFGLLHSEHNGVINIPFDLLGFHFPSISFFK
jgi:hypothetical protein